MNLIHINELPALCAPLAGGFYVLQGNCMGHLKSFVIDGKAILA